MRAIRAVLAAIALFSILTACSGEQPPIDPAAIDATLSTEPSPALAGSPVELRAAFTGASFPDKVVVTFDVRSGDRPELFDASNEGEGLFTGKFTFPEKGVYDVYLHLYVDDLHITKKKQVEVQ